MRRSLLLTVSLCVAFFGSVFAQTEHGTSTDPYLIENETEFWNFHDCMVQNTPFYFHPTYVYDISGGGTGTGTYLLQSQVDSLDALGLLSGVQLDTILPEGKSAEAVSVGLYFKLMCDVIANYGDVAGCKGVKDPSWREWIPFPGFGGHFDGNYHVVSGIYCSRSGDAMAGFFAQMSDEASLCNLGVTNSYFFGNSYVGGLVGWIVNRNLIDQCFFEGSLESSGNNCGGITGNAIGNSVISNCYSTGNVYTTTSSGYYTGGLVGYLGTNTRITNCYTSMMVSGVSSVGGLAGHNDGSGIIENSYYDLQMASLDVVTGEGRFTRQMTSIDAAWTVLGDKFTATTGLYPYLSGFSLDNPHVRLSVQPLFLKSTSNSTSDPYETMLTLHTDFTFSTDPLVSWSTDPAIGGAMTVDASTHSAHLLKEGDIKLIATIQQDGKTYTRTILVYPSVSPFFGTAENPFTIDNLEEMESFRNGINSGADFVYKRYYNIDYSHLSDVYWLMTDDIDFTSIPDWNTVGYNGRPFKGHFDGGGHVVSHLKITGTGNYKGLFGSIEYADIRNLTLLECNIHAGQFVGGVCGYNKESKITHCDIVNSVIYCTSQDVGGICGGMYGGDANGVISYCNNFNTDVTAYIHTGGICGTVWERGGINHCYNNGFIWSTKTTDADDKHTGGIVGYARENYNPAFDNVYNAYIRDCRNDGGVKASDCVGGIAGCGYNVIERCINTGTMYAQAPNATNCVGGIFGYGNNAAQVRYCINTGTVMGSENNGQMWASGIGMSASIISHCMNAGVVDGVYYAAWGITQQSGGTVDHCLNVGRVRSNNSPRDCKPLSGGTPQNCFYDQQMVLTIATQAGNKNTSELIGTGSVAKTPFGNTWLYEEGMYPRLAWTDTVDWARDVAIVASTPVLGASGEADADHVGPGFKLCGCDSNITWKVQPLATGQTQGGCLFRDFTEGQTITGVCENNAITPEIAGMCLGMTTVGAYLGDTLVKCVILRRDVTIPADTLTIDSIQDLRRLQAGVNSGEAFEYKGVIVPRHAEGTHFLLRYDPDLSSYNWEPIGNGIAEFEGIFLGGNHTVSNLKSTSSRTYAGLFGVVKGKGRVQDLNLENVNISNGSNSGAVAAYIYDGSDILNCTVSGVITGGTNAGGIVGSCGGTDSVVNCINQVAVTATNAGGVVGSATSNTIVIGCVNEGAVSGSSYAAGIVGNSGKAYGCSNHAAVKCTSGGRLGGICGDGYAEECYNTGEITGVGATTHIGGICGNGNPKKCYNVCKVTAAAGTASANTYVGGISGYGNPTYCYNAGQVTGNNRKYVGGVVGYSTATTRYCYNSNTVRSEGEHTGSIAGASATNAVKDCYYDNQLSLFGAVDNADNTSNKALGRLASDMLAENLKPLLGTSTVWYFGTNQYPQLACFEGTDPSVASVMPIRLASGDNWRAVSSSFQMHGCVDENTGWRVLIGNCLVVNPSVCEAQKKNIGISTLGAAVNGHVYKEVRLLVGVNENTPLYVKSLTEMKNFRDVINNGGYYNWSDSTYHTSLPASLNPPQTAADSVALSSYMELNEGGLDLYFILLTDLDMSNEAGYWTPVGDYASSTSKVFRGTFYGNHKTVSGLKLGGTTNASYRGLFGFMSYGEIRDLTITHSSITGTGQIRGLLVGQNTAGLIYNCTVEHSKISGEGRLVGAVCGYSAYGTIDHCYSIMDTLTITSSSAPSGTTATPWSAGICGANDYGVIKNCQTDQLYATTSKGNMAGIVGSNYGGTVDSCLVTNSKFYNITAAVCGGVVGQNSATTTSPVLPATVRHCASINTTIDITGDVSNIGGVIGVMKNNYTTVSDCYATGGHVTSVGNYVGGIVGSADRNGTSNITNSNIYILNCHNENPVKGKNYVGGIAGSLKNGSYVDSCFSDD